MTCLVWQGKLRRTATMVRELDPDIGGRTAQLGPSSLPIMEALAGEPRSMATTHSRSKSYPETRGV